MLIQYPIQLAFLVTVSLWDGSSFKKAKFTFLEIGKAVVNKVVSFLVVIIASSYTPDKLER